ncbi:TerB family tellurite resistance protein [Candidatus Sulfurimonas baltica]|uniref:TerB family tellurite resistance protein n=1 Tax=Candidatus Sulfurimonas baltica TaxID=2740404 RepID=A0A7S7RP95_9BACT|nr:TerB family tellurite resistance protein [Candidatus Sulfurimonas baltica]QOY53250.1 TerB family tellurite resistance protein [Candidatus Sulfurimonas baltica]
MFNFLSGMDLFNQHTNKDAIKNILAVLMIVVVKADDKVSVKEQNKVLSFYKNEFGMDTDATEKLFDSVKHDDATFHSSLAELKIILQDDITAKAKALHHLNGVMYCDGSVNVECDLFEDIRKFLI